MPHTHLLQMCKFDAHALAQRLQPLGPERRREVVLAARPEFGKAKHRARLMEIVRTGNAGCLWQADHIIPVKDGGGECGLVRFPFLGRYLTATSR